MPSECGVYALEIEITSSCFYRKLWYENKVLFYQISLFLQSCALLSRENARIFTKYIRHSMQISARCSFLRLKNVFWNVCPHRMKSSSIFGRALYLYIWCSLLVNRLSRMLHSHMYFQIWVSCCPLMCSRKFINLNNYFLTKMYFIKLIYSDKGIFHKMM